MRLYNDPNSAAGIREAARKGFNIIHGMAKANANPHTKRIDPAVRAIIRRLSQHRS